MQGQGLAQRVDCRRRLEGNRQQSAENNIWNHYAGLAGIGQQATNQVGAYGQNYANQTGNILQNNASFQGAAGIAGWNQAANGINQGISAWGRNGYQTPSWFGSGNGNDVGIGSYDGNNYSGSGDEIRQRHADGGPVRQQPQLDANGIPIVGQRTAVRTGGAGGLTANALLQLLQSQQSMQPQPLQRSGLGLLTANPVIDPQAILLERMKQAGAYAMGGAVEGPGGPKDDMIPAQLSDGEHVITAKAVRGAGNGDREKGHAALNKLQAMLERRA